MMILRKREDLDIAIKEYQNKIIPYRMIKYQIARHMHIISSK